MPRPAPIDSATASSADGSDGLDLGLRFWLLDLAAWTLLAVANAGAVAADLARSDRAIDWPAILANNALLYSPWVLITAAVFAWVRRTRRLRGGRRIAAFVGLVAGWLVLYAPTAAALGSLVAHGSPNRWREVLTQIPTTSWVLDSVFLFAVLGVASTVGTLATARRREREAARLALANSELEARLAATRLQMLKAQLEPHVLYNALNTIAALVRTADQATAVRAVGRLSELLRYATRATSLDRVTLADEVDFAEAYLSFQELRFGDRLTTVLTIDDDALPTPIPPLVLQPLLDNAIRHGIERHEGAGRVTVEGGRHGDRLRVTVRNAPGALDRSSRSAEGLGIGLDNTRRRLEAAFGEAATLDLRDDDGGVVATLEVPWSSTWSATWSAR